MKLSDSLTKPNCGVDQMHDLLGQPRQVHRGDRRRRQEFQREVAVGHGVERVGRRPVEAERLGGHVAVDRKRGAGERGGAERAFVQPLARVGKAAAVARRHLDIGQQMMAEGHRLRRLQMGEARHHRAGMLQRLARRARADKPASAASSASMASRTHSRKSVATWSLRERAVCSRPAAGPISSASRPSTFMWMSSSARLKANLPASISDRIVSRP